MDAPLPLNTAWVMFGGVVVAGAALKELAGRIAESPLVVAPKHPTLVGTMVVALILKDAVGRIGSSATGLPAGP